MNILKLLVSILLSLSLVFSFCACSIPEASDGENEEITEPSDDEKEEEEETEENKKDEDDEEKKDEDDEKPEEERKSYSVRYVSDLKDAKISSIYGIFTSDLYPFALSIVEGDGKLSLIDYEGNIKVSVDVTENSKFSFCPVCKCLTDHMTKIDPLTLEVSEHFAGHGFSSTPYYYYDAKNNQLFSEFIGGYASPDEDTEGAYTVRLITGRPATENEAMILGSDTYYELTDKYGIFIDGELKIPCEYDKACTYAGGLCGLAKGDKWGFFDEKGNQIFDFEFSDSTNAASYGLIALCKDGKWAYGNTKGELVTDFEFEEACSVYNGLAWVKQDGVWKVIEFLKYDKGISEFEAKQLVESDLEKSSHNYISISVSPIDRSDYVSMYLTEGYCFSTELMYENGNISTSLCYFVMPDGTILVYYVDSDSADLY